MTLKSWEGRRASPCEWKGEIKNIVNILKDVSLYIYMFDNKQYTMAKTSLFLNERFGPFFLCALGNLLMHKSWKHWRTLYISRNE